MVVSRTKTAENPKGIENRTTEQNSLIIIGANGSGKSRLGAWMEDKNLQNVHRISGQRALNFAKHISEMWDILFKKDS